MKRPSVDYGHRYKMLKNHAFYGESDKKKIYRLVVGKKNKYLYAGIYVVKDWNLPDICKYYSDTRRYSTLTTSQKIIELTKDIAMRLMPLASDHKTMVVIDLGRRKKINISSFKESLKSELKNTPLRIRGL